MWRFVLMWKFTTESTQRTSILVAARSSWSLHQQYPCQETTPDFQAILPGTSWWCSSNFNFNHNTMTIITDKVNVPDGTDFTFVCKKIPFAISCLSEIPYRDANLVDLDLVNKMGIPLRNIKVTRMSLLGHDVCAVGRIKQTIQCVSRGRVQGTIHLDAKVIRDLYTILGADCIASARTYSKLMGKKPPDPPNDDQEDEDNQQPIIHLWGDERKERKESCILW